jgi:hypothetical protein
MSGMIQIMTMRSDTKKLRAARADACKDGLLYLLKRVSSLRLTYQIRLLAFQATETASTLIIEVPPDCTIAKSLTEFVDRFGAFVKIVRH